MKNLSTTVVGEREALLEEIAAQKRLMTVYKGSLDQAQTQMEEVQESERSLKDTLARVTEEYKQKLEKEKRRMEQVLEQQHEHSTNQINSFQPRLVTAQSPAASSDRKSTRLNSSH